MPPATQNQTPEQIACDQIDKKLAAAGWHVQDKDKINFNAGPGVAVREYLTDIGEADYVLFVDRQAAGVIEAKPDDWGHKITTVEEQSEGYASAKLKWVANKKPLPFVYESTGVVTRFTDGRDPKPRSREVFTFPRPETMAEWLSKPQSLRARLHNIPPLDPAGFLTYWECSEGLKQPGSATPVEWLYKTAPGRKDEPVIDSDVTSGGPWKLSLELSPATRQQGWTELGKSRPEAVASSELEPLFQDYFYDHRSVRQLLAEPLLYAAIAPLLVLYIALMMRKDLGLEWYRLCDEVSASELAFHWRRNWNQFALYIRLWIHRVIEVGMSQLQRGRLDSPTSTLSIRVPDTYQQAQSSAMKGEKQSPSSTPKKQPQRRSIFPGTASVRAASKQPKPWDKSQWID